MILVVVGQKWHKTILTNRILKFVQIITSMNTLYFKIPFDLSDFVVNISLK